MKDWDLLIQNKQLLLIEFTTFNRLMNSINHCSFSIIQLMVGIESHQLIFFKVKHQHNSHDRSQRATQQWQSIFDQVKISRWIKGAQTDQY
jgi:hypothetical protein